VAIHHSLDFVHQIPDSASCKKDDILRIENVHDENRTMKNHEKNEMFPKEFRHHP